MLYSWTTKIYCMTPTIFPIFKIKQLTFFAVCTCFSVDLRYGILFYGYIFQVLIVFSILLLVMVPNIFLFLPKTFRKFKTQSYSVSWNHKQNLISVYVWCAKEKKVRVITLGHKNAKLAFFINRAIRGIFIICVRKGICISYSKYFVLHYEMF